MYASRSDGRRTRLSDRVPFSYSMYVFAVAEIVRQYLIRTGERIERLAKISRQCIRDDSMYSFEDMRDLWRHVCVLAFGLVRVRLVLGLELESVGRRTQEHFTVVSMDG